MKSAIDVMEEYFEWGGRSWIDDMSFHLRGRGICLFTQELVLMARPVCSYATFDEIVNPQRQFSQHCCDAWFVHFLSGQLECLSHYEYLIAQYPIIIFQRGRRDDCSLHFMQGCRFIRLLPKHQEPEIMGFSKPKIITPPTPEPAPLPVKEVDMTQEVKKDVLNKEKKRQGLMSTLLTNRNNGASQASIGQKQSLLNKTLG